MFPPKVYLCGKNTAKLQVGAPCSATEHVEFRKRIGPEGAELIHWESIKVNSDLKGIIYTPVDKEDMWRFRLAKRLKTAGYEVNTDVLL